jgi:hypothetical protein
MPHPGGRDASYSISGEIQEPPFVWKVQYAFLIPTKCNMRENKVRGDAPRAASSMQMIRARSTFPPVKRISSPRSVGADP